MNLTELKTKTPSELVEIASSLKLDGLARSRKQDVIFAILKAQAKNGEDIFGDGVLERTRVKVYLDSLVRGV